VLAFLLWRGLLAAVEVMAANNNGVALGKGRHIAPKFGLRFRRKEVCRAPGWVWCNIIEDRIHGSRSPFIWLALRSVGVHPIAPGLRIPRLELVSGGHNASHILATEVASIHSIADDGSNALHPLIWLIGRLAEHSTDGEFARARV